MKRLALIILTVFFALPAISQKNIPKWMDKARKAVFTITTYDKDNKELSTGNGFFITETGESLSGYTLFKGAGRAVVTDSEGKEYPVTHIIGADELYDVVRFKVDVPKKVPFLAMHPGSVSEGDPVYLLQYSQGKDASFTTGKVTEITKLKEIYNYYQVDYPLSSGQINLPLVSSSGQVLGLSQEDASGKKEISYALSAPYGAKLEQSSVDVFNPAYRNIGIRKSWMSDEEDASISLFLMASQQDAKTYLETVNDYIRTFPNSSQGYLSRAIHMAYKRYELEDDPEARTEYLNKALEDMKTALSKTNKKGDVLYEEAKMIFQVVTNDPDDSADWTLDMALQSLQKAYSEDPNPLYKQLEGDIHFSEEKYAEAYDAYEIVNNSDQASPASFYWASKAKENIPGSNIGEMIDLLTRAVELTGEPITVEAAPFLLERIDKKLILSLFDEAIADYDLYFSLVDGQVSGTFFYLREQAKFRKGDLQGALEDIQEAIAFEPQNPDYLAEETSVYIRMQNYNAAIESADKALAIAPDFAACYRLKGICLLRMEKQVEACEAFVMAKEYGDPVAEKLINDNCN